MHFPTKIVGQSTVHTMYIQLWSLCGCLDSRATLFILIIYCTAPCLLAWRYTFSTRIKFISKSWGILFFSETLPSLQCNTVLMWMGDPIYINQTAKPVQIFFQPLLRCYKFFHWKQRMIFLKVSWSPGRFWSSWRWGHFHAIGTGSCK